MKEARQDLKRTRKTRPIGYNYIKCAICGRPNNFGGTIPVRKDGRIIEICKSINRCGQPDENKQLRRI